MYRVIEIDGKEYKQEFTIEASLNHECIEKLVNLMTSTAVASNIDTTGMSEEEALKAAELAAKESIRSMSDIPDVAMHLWYAGFLEYHGPEGDRTVMSVKDAKALYKKYYAAKPEERSMYDIITMCMEQMEADGFFELTGLLKMIGLEPEPKRQPKTPQDYKKKAKATETA